MRWRWVVLILAMPLLAAGPFAPRPAAATLTPAPAGAGGAATGCVSDWYVSYGGLTSWNLVHTDPDGLPLSDLYFSRTYNDPTDLSSGYLDFDRDRRSDVFSAVPIGGGFYRWRYSSGAASDWINLAYDSTPPDQLRFGDFNGDGYTDVFTAVPTTGGLRWKYSPGGTDSFVNLARDTTPLDQLRFGDFNGDGRTDVFVLKDIGFPILGWDVSYSGTTNYDQINSAPTPLSEMAFGDINDDGHTDVFTTVPNGNNFDWLYSSAGGAAYQTIATNRGQSVHDVLLAGNFDISTSVGYGGTDIFYTTLRFDGAYQWWYFFYEDSSHLGDTPLAYDVTPPDQLRFGDFNGDGVTDIFRLQQRCKTYLPLVKK